ncbi:hypothetical protein PG994_003488 [Apiospora phragmitis]|uniref:Methyltransferase type 11 domain-containing protein n=1 Tax=Apiospora phragmitis TaxID=2905665 RepID=A0ABR1VY91_9PEZI
MQHGVHFHPFILVALRDNGFKHLPNVPIWLVVGWLIHGYHFGQFEYDSFIKYVPSAYWTAPVRNFRSSVRLYLQHYLFQRTLRYLQERHVQDFASTSSHGVADIGCGNGVWLCDLHNELAKAGCRPSWTAISLKQLGILRPRPEETTGLYDIVHSRAFGSILIDTGVAPLFSGVLALLKPGVYLQWEESRDDKVLIEVSSADTPNVACNAISQIILAVTNARGSDFAFINELDQKVKDFGFEDVHMVPFE